MNARPANLLELRQLLAQRFPPSSLGFSPAPSLEMASTGVPELDALLGGGLPQGEITELVGVGHGSGSTQVLHTWLRTLASAGQFLALIDGVDSFDVGALPAPILTRLLWVRCHQVTEALKAADLLLRDRNFPWIALDLKSNPISQLRAIPSTTWHRFSRLLEQHRATVLGLTPFPLISGATSRVQIESRLGVEALSQSPEELKLRCTLLRSRGSLSVQQSLG